MKTITRTRLSAIKKREGEPWIYSYADLVTNLLAFFMMLLIISTSKSPSATAAELVEGIRKHVEEKIGARRTSPDAQPISEDSVDELRQIVDSYLKQTELGSQVSLSKLSNGFEMTFEGALLFDLASAEIRPESESVLENIAELLKEVPERFIIDVEGHTDNLPVSGPRYPSNWELSSARAGSVVRFLEKQEISGTRVRAIGYANTRPIDGSGESEINRRVVIKVSAEVDQK
jgi:chemotaxis protein MotB